MHNTNNNKNLDKIILTYEKCFQITKNLHSYSDSKFNLFLFN